MPLPDELIFKQIESGPMGNFVYFIGDARSRQIAIVDPAWDVNSLCDMAKRNNYTICLALLTHGHPDHVNGLKTLLSQFDIPAYISKHESSFLKPLHKNLVEVSDRQKISIGSIEIECILTPGHTPGSQCFKYKDILITGDTLFIDGCGRCDLPGSNPKEMYNTLYNILMKFPDSTIIFPGHNYGDTPSANLSSLKKTNPYLTCSTMEEFLSQRMGVNF